MRKFANPVVNLERTEESNRADNRYEVLDLDRNQKSPQDRPIRIHHRVGQKNTENRSGASNGRYERISPGQQEISEHHTDSGPDSTEEIKLKKLAGSPYSFQIGAEHPQSQHVPNDVAKAAMQEQIRRQLPYEEVPDDFDGN